MNKYPRIQPQSQGPNEVMTESKYVYLHKISIDGAQKGSAFDY